MLAEAIHDAGIRVPMLEWLMEQQGVVPAQFVSAIVGFAGRWYVTDYRSDIVHLHSDAMWRQGTRTDKGSTGCFATKADALLTLALSVENGYPYSRKVFDDHAWKRINDPRTPRKHG